MLNYDHAHGRPSRIHARKFLEALRDAGIIRSEDYVRRVVIDAEVNSALRVYVERWGDERYLKLATTLEGVQITEVTPKAEGE